MKEELQKRLSEIKAAIEQSASNHHALLGRYAEVQHLIEECDKPKEEEIKSCD